MARLLVVDGDDESLTRVRTVLESGGHAVRYAQTGREAIAAAHAERPDAVLSEVALPDLAPFELLRELKRDPLTTAARIIVVSERAAEVDRVVAFELGVDDYVTKPFSTRELLLRVTAVLRGAEVIPETQIGPLTIDRAAARVWVDRREIGLTRLERDLLLDLVDAQGRVRSREELVRHVIGDGGSLRAVDSHVKRLRAKLGRAASLVETVKGVGYRFASPRDGGDDGR